MSSNWEPRGADRVGLHYLRTGGDSRSGVFPVRADCFNLMGPSSNAALEREIPIRAGETREVSLEFAGDSFVTVEVEGEVDATFEAVNPGFPCFAFTNPIFVDADGDGEWTAPGLPASLPATIRDPLRYLD